jgi:hypothetical protein
MGEAPVFVGFQLVLYSVADEAKSNHNATVRDGRWIERKLDACFRLRNAQANTLMIDSAVYKM